MPNYFSFGPFVLPHTIGGSWITLGFYSAQEIQQRVHWLRIPGDPGSTPTFGGLFAAIRGKYLGGWQQVAIIEVDLSGDTKPRMRPSLVFKDPKSGYAGPMRSHTFEEIPPQFAVLLGRDEVNFAIDAQFVGKVGMGPKLTLVKVMPRSNLSGMNIPLF